VVDNIIINLGRKFSKHICSTDVLFYSRNSVAAHWYWRIWEQHNKQWCCL